MAYEEGQSGNPKGRPKKAKLITQQLIAALGEVDPTTQATKTRRIIEALIEKANTGDIPAIREILDRVEGKVPQGIEGDEDNPLHVLHRIENVIIDSSKA